MSCKTTSSGDWKGNAHAAIDIIAIPKPKTNTLSALKAFFIKTSIRNNG
jgi:hypothetical protein